MGITQGLSTCNDTSKKYGGQVQQSVNSQLFSKATKLEKMAPTELPIRPWQHLIADLLGAVPTVESVMALVDNYRNF